MSKIRSPLAKGIQPRKVDPYCPEEGEALLELGNLCQKRNFNDMLSAMRSITEVVQNQSPKLDAWFGKKEVSR